MTWADNQISGNEYKVGRINIKTDSSEPSGWVCHLDEVIQYRPLNGDEPNWFHRKMMRLLFGFRWEKN